MKRKKIRLTFKDRFRLGKIKKLVAELKSVIRNPKWVRFRRHKKIHECNEAIVSLDNEYFKPRVEEIWKRLSIQRVHPYKYYFETFESLIKHQKKLLDTDSKEELKQKLR